MVALSARQAALVPKIYDAVVSGDTWPLALDAVAEGSEARGAVLFALDTVGYPFAIQRFSSIYSEVATQYYLENFSQYEREGWDLLQKAPPRTIVMDQDVWPSLHELSSRPDYVWLLDKANVLRRGAARLNDSPGWIDSVGLQYPTDLERVPLAVLGQAEAMLPHLAKAVELHRSFALLRSHYQAVLTALDRVKIGVCVTAPSGAIIISNTEAQRIFDLSDGIVLGRDGRLLCAKADLSATLALAITDAALTARGAGDASETLLAVPRRSGGYPFLVEIAPLSDSVGELEHNLKGAIVFIVDPVNTRQFSIEKAARCFNLSSAESIVCALMVQGLTDGEIAQQRDVSVETVKTQAKSVYAKSNTRRRSELIRMVLSITPPIEGA